MREGWARLGSPQTLAELVKAEIDGAGGDASKCKFKDSVVLGLLWLNRATMFVTTYVGNLEAGDHHDHHHHRSYLSSFSSLLL